MADINDLSKIHSDTQIKFSYYIIGLSIAGIGFATNKTSGQAFALSQIPLGLCVACFILSAYNGFSYVLNFLDFWRKHHDMMEVDQIMNLRNKEEIKREIQGKIDTASDKSVLLWRYLLNFFYFGLGLFMFWHLLEMYFKSNPLS
jgi:hypothetical protein